MSDPRTPVPTFADASRDDGVTATEIIAGALSVGWLTITGLFFIFADTVPDNTPQDGLRTIMVLLAIFMPVAIIWVAATTARSARIAREEGTRLQASVDALRQAYLADRQVGASTAPPRAAMPPQPVPVAPTIEPPAPMSPPDGAFHTSRTIAPPQPTSEVTAPVAFPAPTTVDDPQPSLPLGGGDTLAPTLDRDDMIRALNFPDDERDEEGFRALRRALKAHQARQLIQAAQDVLTLLSQDGVYMDDLTPDRARAEIWRRFAAGERGRVVAALGGIRDKQVISLITARMRDDLIFRDSAHHFLRLFDRMIAEFEPDASDEQMAYLSETRSARAFMVLGRVAGTFD